eukprot:6186427-Pleurochrysis_carterae.AAC.7
MQPSGSDLAPDEEEKAASPSSSSSCQDKRCDARAALAIESERARKRASSPHSEEAEMQGDLPGYARN